MKCTTCGARFKPLKENRYTVQLMERKSLLETKIDYWDVFDCPKCGCQNLGSFRYNPVIEEVEE